MDGHIKAVSDERVEKAEEKLKVEIRGLRNELALTRQNDQNGMVLIRQIVRNIVALMCQNARNILALTSQNARNSIANHRDGDDAVDDAEENGFDSKDESSFFRWMSRNLIWNIKGLVGA